MTAIYFGDISHQAPQWESECSRRSLVTFESAQIAAAQDGGQTSECIQNYEIKSEEDRIKIAKIAAAQNGWGTSKYIQNYKVNSEAALIEIAKIAQIAAAQDGWGISEW